MWRCADSRATSSGDFVMSTQRVTPGSIGIGWSVAAAALLFAGCGGGAGGGGGGSPDGVAFRIMNGAGMPVSFATVYLVPAGDIDERPITGDDVLTGEAEDRDEPLEDAVRRLGGSFPQAVTDVDGRASIDPVPLGRYFWFVMPGAGDLENLPGGSDCRRSREATTFLGTTVTITLSSRPSTTAAHVGTTTCLVCHPQYATEAQHAHRLGFAVPGRFASLQDPVRYPDFTGGWDRFLPAQSYTSGTVVYLFDFDPTRGFDKFRTTLADPSPAQSPVIRAYLWRDLADDRFKITLENAANPQDPRSPWTLPVELTYGGAVFKQRLLVGVPGRKGLYPLLQWQNEGDESRFDRTRKVYRDYHADWFWDNTTQTFKDPPLTANFDGNCTGCHATGFQRFQDPVTQEWLTGAVDDPGGAYDIDGNGIPNEINIGCENCHGAGSEHVAWAANQQNQGREARFIVRPELLSPSREIMICGRCHDRVRGNGPLANEEPLNPLGEMPPVGVSREEYLRDFVTRKGPAASDYWSDGVHSKSHHQQYSDLLKSTMHRNDRILTVCSDCHESHGYAPFPNHLNADPRDPNSRLCSSCHAEDLTTHMLAETGSTHALNVTTCSRCHMPQTAKTGAGRYGLLRGVPTGTSTDPTLTYFENDITSHLFLVPRKTHPDVAGVLPGSAMPIPYTGSCGGPCHDPGSLADLRSYLPRIPESVPDADDYGEQEK
jgi:hypothetical protein